VRLHCLWNLSSTYHTVNNLLRFYTRVAARVWSDFAVPSRVTKRWRHSQICYSHLSIDWFIDQLCK
jgi:hypothetical protein